jgi:hypothetical protein
MKDPHKFRSPKTAQELLDIYYLDIRCALLETAAALDRMERAGNWENAKKDPERVCFDHCEEHTIRMIREAGFWSAMTIYPVTKNSPTRVVDIIEIYGLEKILVDASGDWGPSDPGSLHDAIFEMKKRGHREEDIETVFYNNPCYFLGQCEKFQPKPTVPQKEAWRYHSGLSHG